MRRRTFLSLFVGAGAAATSGAGAVLYRSLAAFVDVRSTAGLFPGATFEVVADTGCPADARLVLQVKSGGESWDFDCGHLTPGETHCLDVPYPHDDFVKGTYRVTADLKQQAVSIERHDVGTYTLRPLRFSA